MAKILTVKDSDGNIQTWDDLKELIQEAYNVDVDKWSEERKLAAMNEFIVGV